MRTKHVWTEEGTANGITATLALLIDGDNASSKIITGLLDEVANYGVASVKCTYGDCTGPNRKGWKECLLEQTYLGKTGARSRYAR